MLGEWLPPRQEYSELSKRYVVIACDILRREFYACAAQCRPIVDLCFLPKSLHDLGAGPMASRVQEAIDHVDPAQYDAILMGYGLCSNGTLGLRAPVPMVIPRAHDCITLLLGSRKAYREYFVSNPGTYFLSPGWIERVATADLDPKSIPSQLGMDRTYEEYVAAYGEDNAKYLMDTLGSWLKQYRKLAYIDTGTGDFGHFKEWAREQAGYRGWEYEQLAGSTDLILRLLSGAWDEADFLVIPPGSTAIAAHDDHIVRLNAGAPDASLSTHR